MRKRHPWLRHIGTIAILISIFGYITAAVPSDNQESAPLKLVADIPSPGAAVRFGLSESRRFSWPSLYRPHERRSARCFRYEET